MGKVVHESYKTMYIYFVDCDDNRLSLLGQKSENERKRDFYTHQPGKKVLAAVSLFETLTFFPHPVSPFFKFQLE